MNANRKIEVIEATAEALPLELLNKTNKELTAQLSQCENQLQEKLQSIEEQRKRLQFMKEHLSNVGAEVVNTQSLSESKRREVESETNVCHIITRECSRLEQRKGQLQQEEETLQDRIMSIQGLIFQKNVRVQELKETMNFNHEELEQWHEARRQKEEDELAVARYTKQDEAKIRQLTQRAEQLEGQVRATRQQLADEILAAHTVQRELDNCATDYRKLHDERSGMLKEWERVIRAIAERDNAIRTAAEQYGEGAEWLLRRNTFKKELAAQLDQAKEEASSLNYSIQERERKAQQLRDALPKLTQQVEELADELEAMREQVRHCVRQRNDYKAGLQRSFEEIQSKTNALEITEQRREAAAKQLQEEMEAARDIQKQSDLIHRLLKDAQKTSDYINRDIENLKRSLFKANQELHTTREKQNSTLAEIAGAQLQGKNLTYRMNQLDNEAFSQQTILYSIEFNVQQMEKKVQRAKGEHTDEEKRELEEKIILLQSTLDELDQQHRVLDVQVKRVREELRQSNLAAEKLDKEKKLVSEEVTQYDLECRHCEHEAKTLEKQLEDALINSDTLKLQLKRAKRTLAVRQEERLDVQGRKQQLEADIAESIAEVAVHHDLLKIEIKVVEEERRRVMTELLQRQKSLAGLRNRHAVAVGHIDPAHARLTQAQLVLDAAREREALQHRGDALDVRVRRMEKEMLKLEKAIAIIKGSNAGYKHKFDVIKDDDEEVRTQKTLLDRLHELKSLMSRRLLHANDYRSTLEAKKNEVQRLMVELEKTKRSLQDIQHECDQAAQSVLRAREEVIRCEQAIAKVKNIIDPIVGRNIELVETTERLTHTVHRLLECSQAAGEEVYNAVRQMIIDLRVPLDLTASDS